jgi:hypothetical protein
MSRPGGGARILVARLAQVLQWQRGAPLNNANPVFNPFHVHPNIQGCQKVVIKNRFGMKMSQSVEVQQKASPVCSA